jgi:hypothetical protein
MHSKKVKKLHYDLTRLPFPIFSKIPNASPCGLYKPIKQHKN